MPMSQQRNENAQVTSESVAEQHLTNLLNALKQEQNTKYNLNEWMRCSPSPAPRVAQAEDQWVKSVKHLVSVEMAAREYMTTKEASSK